MAGQYEEAPASRLDSPIQNDPPVHFAEGVGSADLAAATLWDVPETFKNCVEELLERDIDALSLEDIQMHFARAVRFPCSTSGKRNWPMARSVSMP